MADYVALTKPRVVLMVLVTTLVGYYLGASGDARLVRLLHSLLGTALAAGGTLALNQFLERDLDARMQRTRSRPLPDGRLQPGEAPPSARWRPWPGWLRPGGGGRRGRLVTAAISVLYLWSTRRSSR